MAAGWDGWGGSGFRISTDKKSVASDNRICDICGVKESGPSKAARKRKRKT